MELFSFQMFSRSKIHLYFSKESDMIRLLLKNLYFFGINNYFLPPNQNIEDFIEC